MSMVPVYDPGSGEVSYEDQPIVSPSTGVSDSGYSYTRDIFDLLKFGTGVYAENERYKFDEAKRYEVGRGGRVTQFGYAQNPFASPTGGINATGMILAAVLVAGVLYFALKR